MGRKERRAAERIERRDASERAAWIIKRNAVENAAIAKLTRNGITPEDLEKEYDKGYSKGFREAGEPVLRGVYAAVCLALKDTHGFGAKRCMDVLKTTDEHLKYSLTSTELIDEVWERVGLKLVFTDPFDRIQEL